MERKIYLIEINGDMEYDPTYYESLLEAKARVSEIAKEEKGTYRIIECSDSNGFFEEGECVEEGELKKGTAMKPLHLQKPDRALIRTYVRGEIYRHWIMINTYVNGCSDRCRKSKDFWEILNSLMFELYAKISMIPDCPEYDREKKILQQSAIDYKFRLSDVEIGEIREDR